MRASRSELLANTIRGTEITEESFQPLCLSASVWILTSRNSGAYAKLDRQAVDALARRRKHGVHQRPGNQRGARLADAAGRLGARHDVDLDLRHLVVPQHLVVAEVALHDAPVLIVISPFSAAVRP